MCTFCPEKESFLNILLQCRIQHTEKPSLFIQQHKNHSKLPILNRIKFMWQFFFLASASSFSYFLFAFGALVAVFALFISVYTRDI